MNLNVVTMKTYPTILFIDNQKINGVFVKSILEDHVTFNEFFDTTSGVKAMDWLSKYLNTNYKLPELVFINVEIRGFDSFAIIQRIVETDVYRQGKTRIVAILNRALDDNLKKRLDSFGIFYKMFLPITDEKILQVL